MLGNAKTKQCAGQRHDRAGQDLAQGLFKVGEDGAVPLGQNGKGERAVVVLHHTHVVVALGQRSLGLDVETVGVPCTHPLAQTYSGP